MDIIVLCVFAVFLPPLEAYFEKRHWTEKQLAALKFLLAFVFAFILILLKNLFIQVPLERTQEFIDELILQALALSGASRYFKHTVWEPYTPYLEMLRSVNSGEKDV